MAQHIASPRRLALTVTALLLSAGCGASSSDSEATGGSSATGGASATGGGSATDGNSGTSGSAGSPASTGSAGSLATGGSPGSGGGGASTGGIVGMSGASGSVGATSTGGALATGGSHSEGTGGGNTGGADAGGTAGAGGADVVVKILPGAVWNDTRGKVIEAHGGSMIKVADTYYWFGEDKTNGGSFQNVTCYSSPDLKTWTFVNNVLTRQDSGDLGPNRIIERPRVIYNASTSQFVMYMHADNSNYSARTAAVATSGSVCGAYTYRGSFKPLGHDSLDDTLFQDGIAGYFASEDRTKAKLQIYRLSDDYLNVASLVATLAQHEAPALVTVGGIYLLMASHLTGWASNDNQYTTATSLAGPWATWQSFAPAGTNTCNSQTTFALRVIGDRATTYMFLADRWNSGNLSDSRYLWEPLMINGTTVSITCATSWHLDVTVGTWSP